MKGGWIQADLYGILYFSKTWSNVPWKTLAVWQKIPWKTLEKKFISLLATLLNSVSARAETFGTLKNLVCTVRSTRKIFAAYLFWSGDLLFCPWSFHFVFIFNFINFTREKPFGVYQQQIIKVKRL